MRQKTDSREASRKSFDRQAATYDEDRNGAHARKMYARVLEKMSGLHFANVLDVGCVIECRKMSDKSGGNILTGYKINEV